MLFTELGLDIKTPQNTPLNREQEEEIALASAELEKFMQDEGDRAMSILRKSRAKIFFGKTTQLNGFSVSVFLNCAGFFKTVDPSETLIFYVKDPMNLPRPEFTAVDTAEAARAAVVYGKKKGTEIVAWLQRELSLLATND